MTHLVVGYPSLEDNWRMLELMDGAGVDLVELQMPFSEPVADGPTFVRANQEALARGMTRAGYFDFMARAAARFGFPHLMMGYYNTVFRMGHGEFCRRLRGSGGRGFILPDLPWEEYGDLFDLSREQDLDPILLMTPTNLESHLAHLGSRARGFVYAVARRGVTGRHTQVEGETRAFVERCRSATPLPLALGFGLRRADDLRQLQGLVEVAIVGSALLEEWERGGAPGYGRLLQELAEARS
ncbi:MAG: tryptophan synthase subunit alpha [Gemmatimonadota bacterium]